MDLEGGMERAASQFGSCSRPCDRPDARRTGGDHPRQSNDGTHGHSLARHRTRQLLRWRARLRWAARQYRAAGRPRTNHSSPSSRRRGRARSSITRTGTKTSNWPAASTGRSSSSSLASATIPATDHIVVIGLNGVLQENEREPFALNGSATPAPIVMRAGVPNRLRLINITATNVYLTALLVDRFEQTTWKPLAKDGATLPAGQTAPRPARQIVTVGETYDFEIQPTRSQRYGWKCAAAAASGCCRRRSGFANHDLERKGKLQLSR